MNQVPCDRKRIGLGCMALTGIYGHIARDVAIDIIRHAFDMLRLRKHVEGRDGLNRIDAFLGQHLQIARQRRRMT